MRKFQWVVSLLITSCDNYKYDRSLSGDEVQLVEGLSIVHSDVRVKSSAPHELGGVELMCNLSLHMEGAKTLAVQGRAQIYREFMASLLASLHTHTRILTCSLLIHKLGILVLYNMIHKVRGKVGFMFAVLHEAMTTLT